MHQDQRNERVRPRWTGWRAWRAGLAVAGGCLLAACGGGGGGSDDAGPQDGGTTTNPATAYSTDPYTPQVPAQPLDLALEVDAARSTTATVTPDAGGTLHATGADGTTYELAVPADATAQALAVTMTPVSRFTRLPFNGGGAAPAWGVRLEPSGAQFLKPLRLRIVPPAGAAGSAAQQLAFGWHVDGQGVQLALLDPTRADIDIQVLHFSGYAVARFERGVAEALQGLRNRLGATPEQRLETVAAERAAAKRYEAVTGQRDPNHITDSDFRNYLQAFVDDVLGPRMGRLAGCADGRIALDTVLNVQNTLRAMNEPPLSFEPYATKNVDELMLQVAHACLQAETTRCARDHVVTDIIPAVQRLDLEARRVAFDPWSADWRNWRARAEQGVAACHVYRLEVDSDSRSDDASASGWHFSETMEGSVDLRLSGPVLEFSDPVGTKSFEIVGAGELDSRAYSMSYNDGCSVVADVRRAPAAFNVMRVGFQRGTDGALNDIRVEYFPGANGSDHLLVDRCNDPPTQSRIPLFNWWSVFMVTVGPDERYFGARPEDQAAAFFLKDWIIDPVAGAGGEARIGHNVFEVPYQDSTTRHVATTKMRLFHKPQTMPMP